MTWFDLLFLALTLAALLTAGSAAITALRGRHRVALRRLAGLGAAIAAYLIVVNGLSIVWPRRHLSLGEDLCSDDWCIEIAGAERGASTGGQRIDVTYRVRSRALRVPQRERFVVSYLLDAAGKRYDPLPAPSAIPFDVILQPGEQAMTTRTFTVPPDAPALGVVIAREGDGPFPRCCIIGLGAWFKPPIAMLATR